MKQLRILIALAVSMILLACAARAAQNISGTWELQRETDSQKLELRLTTNDGDRHSEHTENPLTAADFGLTDARIGAASGQTTFSLKRAAGAFSFTGMLGNGRGGGVFTFDPDESFVRGLSDRGLAPGEPDDLVTAAQVDLTLPYVDSIHSSGFHDISLHNLFAFRALHVTPQSIGELRSTFGDVSENNVISATALGVTKAYVEEMRAMGVSDVTVQKAVEFKALHITKPYVDDLNRLGLGRLSAQQIVEFKAMHIDAAYIKHLTGHGLKNLTPQQIVEAKATGL